jgi:SRSO17 transposase
VRLHVITHYVTNQPNSQNDGALRGWVGWHHHVTLVSVAHGFLTLERLRRPKPAASA